MAWAGALHSMRPGALRAVTIYRAIVADPPWPFRWQGGTGGRRRNATRLGYPTMPVVEIAALRVGELAAADCALFLWTTAKMHREGSALSVMEAWGFSPVGEIVWHKPNFGAGAFPRAGHEVCLVGRRGRAFSDAPRDVHSVQTWKQPVVSDNGGKQHSGKPDGFYDLVELAVPEGPYLELFARRARFGWSYWGDESLSTAEVAA